MKKYLYIIVLGMGSFFSGGCKKENIQTVEGRPEKAIELFFGNDINVNRPPIIHLYKDTVYTLSQFLERRSGEQLIIDEGTLIKVNPSANSYILIDPGAIIQANGTAADPIVFTSNSPAGNQNANWGGITIQGKSSDNASGSTGDANDFSGSLNYVRIEFAGLVLTGVGNRTIVQNLQVSYANPRSSIEIDGGTFNAGNIISYACGGMADLYITRGYTGKMKQVLAYRHPFFGGAGNTVAGIFIENNPNNPGARPNTAPVLSNVTVLGPNGQNGSAALYGDTTRRAAALVTTGNALFHIRNSLFVGFPAAAWYLDDAATADAIRFRRAEIMYSFFQSQDSARTFYLQPGVYPPFVNNDFKDFILGPPFADTLVANVNALLLKDPFNYDHPDPFPGVGSRVLTGANFDGIFGDVFFSKVDHRGALGKDNWFNGWTNFTPLKTNYNFPQ